MNSYFSFLILWQILIIHCSIPNWDIDSLSIELFSSSSTDASYEYILYNQNGYVLKKVITKNSEGKITSKNYLTYNSVTKEVAFEDIESIYYNQLSSEVLICPKGSFHPYEFYYNYYIKPFDSEGNWELSCYKHDTGYFLVFYAHNGNNALYYVKGNNRDYKRSSSFTELYGYKLPEWEKKGHNYEYKFPSLQKQGDNLVLSGFNLIMNEGESTINTNQIQGSTTIIKAKADTQGSIDSNYYFYYFTYNNVSDFSSGYSNRHLDISINNYGNSFSITQNNNKSPLTFVDNVEIKEIKFIPGTKDIYYKIYNVDKGTTYYGLIDVKENKVLYNIEGDEDTIFLPDGSGNMLAITSNKVYKVCMVKSASGDSCDSACENLMLDPDGNKCQNGCDDDKIKMMPEGICISKDSCDMNIYVLNTDETECGLCNYFYPEGTKYKLINTLGCLLDVPNNAEFYNEQWNLVKCKEHYHINGNQCEPDSCYPTCQTCTEVSDDDNNQKCSTCKTGYISDGNGNCVLPPPTTVIKPPLTTIIRTPPTTVIKQIPTTEIKPIPTTVLKPPPTTIIISPPTTIIIPVPPTTIIIPVPPTTIITPAPPTTIIIPAPPTSIIIPAPTTVIVPAPPTTVIIPAPPTYIIDNIPTTVIYEIPTTIVTIIPSTVVTKMPLTIPEVECEEKCLTCNSESNKLGLCLQCNTAQGYKRVNYTIIYTQFLNCIKQEDPKFVNYYYNDTLEEYRPCYKTCKRCLIGGNAEAHHCLECETGYMFRPINNPHNNCVVYSEYYYISSYNQFKSLDIYQCPEEAKYYIKERKSCIDDCKKDEEYKYLYNGNCIKECPAKTDDINYICTVSANKCTLGKNDIYLAERDKLEVIGTLVKSYISEFDYTNHYVSLYENNNYTIIIYKDTNCISELGLEFPDVDFQSCYIKVQQEYGISDNLIIVIVDKKELRTPNTFYSFYHPLSGYKLEAEKICQNETIVVVESLHSVLNKNDSYYKAQTSLTSQGINIFDINDPFYTDICYDFDNPIKKDIPLNDRIKDLYPNVSLCDEGCQQKGINLEDMTSTCDCKFNDIANNNAIKDNALINEAFGEIVDLINSSNILVFKCFKYIFNHFSRSVGGWISLSLIIAHISMTLLYILVQSMNTTRYIISLSKNYITYISTKAKKKNAVPPKRNIDNKAKSEKYSTINSETNLKKKILKPVVKNSKSKFANDELVIPFKVKSKISKKEVKVNIYTEVNMKNSDMESNLELKEFDKNFFEEYMSTSLDDLEFDDAVAKDKRKYCEHLVENLTEDQIIANTFILEEKIKPRAIKIIVFILNIILYFVINGLFFSEEVISELYNIDQEKENFFSFIPRSIERLLYTTFVSIIIGILTSFFFVDEKKIKGIFRREKDDLDSLRKNMSYFIKDLKRRYIIFVIIVFIILIISFFYLLCFNYVYP